jgi:hopene-associated glycosyltransferase HpnB
MSETCSTVGDARLPTRPHSFVRSSKAHSLSLAKTKEWLIRSSFGQSQGSANITNICYLRSAISYSSSAISHWPLRMEWLIIFGSFAWIVLLSVPWRPWSTRERLDATDLASETGDLAEFSVLIPARNEEGNIERTLCALRDQGQDLKIFLIDDQSIDHTKEKAQAVGLRNLTIVKGRELPAGWTGKLWALEQGRKLVTSSFVLLLDADIELAPGIVSALYKRLVSENLDLVSIMATLRTDHFWERWLAPAFVFFFKLIYPFALGNSLKSRLGVAAGGCILLRMETLARIGGFEAVRDAVIDDCALAQRVKDAGGRTWIGLSRSVNSHRPYPNLSSFWAMVSRTAYTQLHYSVVILLATTCLMLIAFWAPFSAVATTSWLLKVLALAGWGCMIGTYLPTVRFYRLSPLWAVTLPVIATLYLLMTWSSAIEYRKGRRSVWKGRVYAR